MVGVNYFDMLRMLDVELHPKSGAGVSVGCRLCVCVMFGLCL